MVVVALLLLAAGGPSPQDVPLPPVPADVPAGVRMSLAAVRKPIEARLDAHNLKVDAFLRDCGSARTGTPHHATCTTEYQKMLAAQAVLDAEKAAFGARVDAALKVPCTAVEAQLERDIDAMRRQQRTNLDGVEALEELEKQAEAEKREALLLGLSGTLDAVIHYAEPKARSAAAFKGYIRLHQAALRQKGVNYDLVRSKLDTAIDNFMQAKIAATAGTAVKNIKDVADMWAQFKLVGEAIGTGLAQGNASLREALADPALAAFVLDNATISDLVRTLVDIGMSAPLMAEVSPQYKIGSFLADAGYQYKKFEALRADVMLRYALSEEMLKAVTALKLQIERTVKRLQVCKASH